MFFQPSHMACSIGRLLSLFQLWIYAKMATVVFGFIETTGVHLSLTHFVGMPSMRAAFAVALPANRGAKQIEAPMVAPPRSVSYAATGMAFDYLARFIMARQFAGSAVRVVSPRWIAEIVVTKCQSGAWPEYKRYGKRWSALVVASSELVEGYIRGQDVPVGRLADTAQMLANLDCLYRAGRCDPDFQPSIDVSADLVVLAEVFDPVVQFAPASALLLNPCFGLSGAVGGADADLILDDLLIDIKTTNSMANPKQYLRQLAGYAALAALGGISDGCGTYRTPIRRLGIYYSRHAKTLIWSLDDVFHGDRWQDYLRTFEQEMKSYRRNIL